MELILQTQLFPISQALWTPNLARWCRKWGPHAQSHVAHRYRSRVANQKRYIVSFTRSMDPQFSQLVTYDAGTPPTISRDTSITWSRDKSKTFYLFIHNACGLQNLVRCWLRMRRPHPKRHMILQLCAQVTNQACHIWSITWPSRCKSKASARQK